MMPKLGFTDPTKHFCLTPSFWLMEYETETLIIGNTEYRIPIFHISDLSSVRDEVHRPKRIDWECGMTYCILICILVYVLFHMYRAI